MLAKEVLRTFYGVSKIEKPPTISCGVAGFSAFRQLVIDRVDFIVHRPFGGVRKVLRNLASTLVEVAINLRLRTVGFEESDGPFEVISAIKQLPRVIDEISELIVIGIVTGGPPSHVR